MELTTIRSEEARLHWRDMLDAASSNGEVVIERYNKPVAVVVNFEQWQRQRQRLQELELLLEAKQISAEMHADPTKVVSFKEH